MGKREMRVLEEEEECREQVLEERTVSRGRTRPGLWKAPGFQHKERQLGEAERRRLRGSEIHDEPYSSR